ncbi:glucose dehydrogenase, partial [Aquibium carbonis]
MMGDESGRRGFGYWFTAAVGLLLAALGVVLGAGGVWLAVLGGS